MLPAQVTLQVGAVTAIPGVFEPIREGLERDRGIRIVYTEKTGTEMLADVDQGKLDLAVAGITMEGWLEAMRSQGRPVRPAFEYKHLQIGVDQLSVLINPEVLTDIDVLVMDLSRDRIKRLFTGEVKNWKELGGPDLPVVVMLSQMFKTTAKVFQDQALDGRPFRADCRVIQGGIAAIAPALLTTPGGITIGPLPLTRNSKIWSPAQAAKIERPFTLVVSDRLDPKKKQAVASLVDYILKAGHEETRKP